MSKKVSNSSLPISISKDKKYFPASGIELKLLAGPTSPIPGPIFPNVAATEPIAVIKSTPIRVIITEPIENITTSVSYTHLTLPTILLV